MKKFTVKFRGKEYLYNGGNCEEVAQKFANRKVFGNPVIFNLALRTYDADTRGEKWAVFIANGDERVEIEARVEETH